MNFLNLPFITNMFDTNRNTNKNTRKNTNKNTRKKLNHHKYYYVHNVDDNDTLVTYYVKGYQCKCCDRIYDISECSVVTKPSKIRDNFTNSYWSYKKELDKCMHINSKVK